MEEIEIHGQGLGIVFTLRECKQMEDKFRILMLLHQHDEMGTHFACVSDYFKDLRETYKKINGNPKIVTT